MPAAAIANLLHLIPEPARSANQAHLAVFYRSSRNTASNIVLKLGMNAKPTVNQNGLFEFGVQLWLRGLAGLRLKRSPNTCA